MDADMNIVILIIYTVSLISAFFCLWVKWDQDADKDRMRTIEKNAAELQQKIEQLQAALKKMGSKDPFTKK